MTRKEAIEILKTDGCYECAVETDSPYNCNNGGCDIREAHYMAIEALEQVDSLERENEFLKSMQRVLTQDIPLETLGEIVNAVQR